MEHTGSYRSLRFMWEYQSLIRTKHTSDLCHHSGLYKFFPFIFMYLTHLSPLVLLVMMTGCLRYFVWEHISIRCNKVCHILHIVAVQSCYMKASDVGGTRVCVCACVFTAAETQGSGCAHIVCVHLVPASCCLRMYTSV